MATDKEVWVNQLYAHVPPPARRLTTLADRDDGRQASASLAEADVSEAMLPQDRVRVVITETDTATAEWLRQALSAHPLVEIVGYARDGLEAAQMARQLEPTVCVIQSELPGMDGYQTCQLISLAAPQVATVVLHNGVAPVDPAEAMRVGARACVKAGRDALELLETISALAVVQERRRSREFALVTDPTKMPVTIAVSAAKGGVGKTTIVTNLAVAMAERYPQETVLVDLYSQYGDAALVLNLAPKRSVVDLAAQAADIDDELIETHLASHESGLRVLAGCAEPNAGDAHLTVDFVAVLLSVLRKRYRFILFDLPPMVNPATLYVISRCQHFLVVINFSELTTLRDTLALLGHIVGTYIDKERVKLIGNRVGPEHEYMIDELEQAAAQPIAYQIPEATDTVLASLNSGEPFVTFDPRAAISASLRGLADLITPARVRQREIPAAPVGAAAALWQKAAALISARR